MRCKFCDEELPAGTHGKRAFCNNAHKQAYWRKVQQEDQAAAETNELTELRAMVSNQAATIQELEQELVRLRALIDIETRYHQDTQARSFKAWLKKQPVSTIGDLGQRLQNDILMPPRGSRAGYEARLRRSPNYSLDDLHELEHLWKLMLLQ